MQLLKIAITNQLDLSLHWFYSLPCNFCLTFIFQGELTLDQIGPKPKEKHVINTHTHTQKKKKQREIPCKSLSRRYHLFIRNGTHA